MGIRRTMMVLSCTALIRVGRLRGGGSLPDRLQHCGDTWRRAMRSGQIVTGLQACVWARSFGPTLLGFSKTQILQDSIDVHHFDHPRRKKVLLVQFTFEPVHDGVVNAPGIEELQEPVAGFHRDQYGAVVLKSSFLMGALGEDMVFGHRGRCP